MTYLAKPQRFNLASFEHYVSTLKWDKGWKPRFPTLHNTAQPTLKEYLAYSPITLADWGANLNHFYQTKQWHSGVHLVAAPDCIWYLCDLEHDGVSVSCWNHLTIGIEMIGDYSTETFTSGPGAKVRDTAVGALAVLSNALGWHPDPLVEGVKGLHFHKMCARDGHPCPGKNVDRADIVKRVVAEMAALKAPVTPSSVPVA